MKDCTTVLMRGASLLALIATTAPALAQPTPGSQQTPVPGEPRATQDIPVESPSQPSDPTDSIVVTGSRLQATGLQAPTPVTVVTTALIQQRSPSTIGEIINQLPAFKNSSGTTVNSFTPAGTQSFADLRGLGAVRTLTLIDGRRPTPSNDTSQFDLNLLPQSMVERIEVVTGGASAAYGSDAVAGVTNFILRHRMEGFTLNATYGLAEEGDNKEYQISGAGGFNLLDDRLHIVFGGDYSKADGIASAYSREWGRREPGIVTLTAARAAGIPSQVVSEGVHASSFTTGGLITSGPLRGTAFGDGGTPYAFNFGSLVGTQTMIGGSNYGVAPQSQAALKAPFQRGAALIRAEYEVNNDTNIFAVVNYGQNKTNYRATPLPNPANFIIGIDNPYIPATTRAAMVAAGLNTITVARQGVNETSLQNDNSYDQLQGTIGAKGKIFKKWTWSVDASYGESRPQRAFLNDPKTANYYEAAYAVKNAAGQIVCGDPATNPYFLAQGPAYRSELIGKVEAGCQPFNIFGPNSISDASKKYINGVASMRTLITQSDFSGNLTGSPFSLPAGEVSVAAGLEYRHESLNQVGCADCLLTKLENSNFPSYSGSIGVTEGYLEVGVPVLKDMALAHALDLNGAVRRTHYTTSGSVTTWKLGAVYEPIEQLRLRFTRSHDIRAPNIAELFNPGANNRVSVTNRINGQTVFANNYVRNNPDLVPEVAETITAGIVLQPTWNWARGFRASVDYYNIDVKQVIGTLPFQEIVDRYYVLGLKEYAPQFVFDSSPAGFRTVIAYQQNLSNLKTKGFDFEVDYNVPMDDIGIPGRLDLRALGNYVQDLRTISKTASGAIIDVDAAGQTVPSWSWDFNAHYGIGRFDANAQVTWKKGIRYSNTLVGPDDPTYNPASNNSISRNYWPDATYVNLQMTYAIIDNDRTKVQLFGSVDNVFDTDPPIIATSLYQTNAAQIYDLIGRTYKIGLRTKF